MNLREIIESSVDNAEKVTAILKHISELGRDNQRALEAEFAGIADKLPEFAELLMSPCRNQEELKNFYQASLSNAADAIKLGYNDKMPLLQVLIASGSENVVRLLSGMEGLMGELVGQTMSMGEAENPTMFYIHNLSQYTELAPRAAKSPADVRKIGAAFDAFFKAVEKHFEGVSAEGAGYDAYLEFLERSNMLSAAAWYYCPAAIDDATGKLLVEDKMRLLTSSPKLLVHTAYNRGETPGALFVATANPMDLTLAKEMLELLFDPERLNSIGEKERQSYAQLFGKVKVEVNEATQDFLNIELAGVVLARLTPSSEKHKDALSMINGYIMNLDSYQIKDCLSALAKKDGLSYAEICLINGALVNLITMIGTDEGTPQYAQQREIFVLANQIMTANPGYLNADHGSEYEYLAVQTSSNIEILKNVFGVASYSSVAEFTGLEASSEDMVDSPRSSSPGSDASSTTHDGMEDVIPRTTSFREKVSRFFAGDISPRDRAQSESVKSPHGRDRTLSESISSWVSEVVSGRRDGRRDEGRGR